MYDKLTMLVLSMLMCIATAAFGSQLPPGVKLCHRSDPNFEKCLAENIADGITKFANGYKELGVPQLEPLFVEKIEIKDDATRTNSIEQKYKNIYLRGITEIDMFKDYKFDLDKGCSWEFATRTPVIRMEADYEIKGQILVFPINAHGKCNITQHNLVNRNKVTCEKYSKNGQTHLRIVNYTMEMKPEKVDYYFEDVFPGNKQIAAEILKTVNENGLEIFDDVKGGFEKVIAFIYTRLANNVFSRIPFNEIFLDT